VIPVLPKENGNDILSLQHKYMITFEIPERMKQKFYNSRESQEPSGGKKNTEGGIG